MSRRLFLLIPIRYKLPFSDGNGGLRGSGKLEGEVPMDSSRIRMLFGFLAGLVFLVLNAVFPGLPFTEDQTVAFFGLIAAFLVGEGLEGPRILDNLVSMAKSWKFRSLIAGIVVLIAKTFWADFPLTEDQVIQAIVMLSALIVGTGTQGAISKVAGALPKAKSAK